MATSPGAASWSVEPDRLDPQTIQRIGRETSPIREAADVLGVSPLAIAVAMTEEIQDRRDKPFVERQLDNAAEALALDYAKRSSHSILEAQLAGVDALIEAGVPESSDALKVYPVMVDVGVGNIKVRTGIQLLRDYLDDPAFADDPLRLETYENAYHRFTIDLIQNASGLQSKIAGLMVAEGQEFFVERLATSDWRSYTEEQQAELLATYYNFGRSAIIERYDEQIADQGRYDPRPSEDEGAINVGSFRTMSNILDAEEAGGATSSVTLYLNDDFASPYATFYGDDDDLRDDSVWVPRSRLPVVGQLSKLEERDLNDEASAIEIRGNLSYTLFEDVDYEGRAVTLEPGTYSLARLAARGIENDDISSFQKVIETAIAGQDLAFVIDTTGSMADDIGAVKSRSASIIDAVFDPDRGLLDSRIAVVGYNDPTTETILPFTDQENPQDRKDAALAAIQRITVSGGGDLPELTYQGLLRALDGRAGEWREDARARKIVLFGDALAKDAELAPLVYAKARNLDVETPAQVGAARGDASGAISDGVTVTSFASVEADPETGVETVVPVQIFTVAIGGFEGTGAEFEEIASATGGAAFRAADASEIVDALLEVIALPIYSITAEVARVEEGDGGARAVEFTVSRDAAGAAAVVELARLGTVDDADVSGVPTSVALAEGEAETTFMVRVEGDDDAEGDETLVLDLVSVSEPATFGAVRASLLILDDEGASEIVGTDEADDLVGSDGPDILRGLGGAYDRMTGGGGPDDFVFGEQARNGARERDVIRDFEVGVDRIVLEDGAAVGAVRAASGGVTVFLVGDGDAIYVRGDGVTPDNLALVTDGGLLV